VVIAEVAMAFVPLVGGGLLMRSFAELQRSSPGFDASNMLTFQTGLQGPDPEAHTGFSRQLGERLRAIPGVVAATAANPLPLSGGVANARWGTEAAAADPASFQQADVRGAPGLLRGATGRGCSRAAHSPTQTIRDRCLHGLRPGEPVGGPAVMSRG
jgi:hypothetical protein